MRNPDVSHNNDFQGACKPLCMIAATMMLIIFPEKPDWYYPNWVFRQLAEDIVRYCSPTASQSALLESCQWYNTLRLDETAEPLRGEMMQLLALASKKTLSGEIPGLIGNSVMQPGYREALSELLLLTDQKPCI
jgi:hypothetical protein